jgi:hypothetical protein
MTMHIPPWNDLKFALLAFVFILIGGFILESTQSFYRIESSKTSESTCALCNNTIIKGTLRIGMSCDEAGYGKWHHLECVDEKFVALINESCGRNAHKIDGFHELKSEDQIRLKKYLNLIKTC